MDVAKLFEERVVTVEVEGTSPTKEKSSEIIPEESTETIKVQENSKSLGSFETSQRSENDSTMLKATHDMLIENTRMLSFDAALFHEFQKTVKMFDKYADTIPAKKRTSPDLKTKKADKSPKK